jgi:hypothetical protein
METYDDEDDSDGDFRMVDDNDHHLDQAPHKKRRSERHQTSLPVSRREDRPLSDSANVRPSENLADVTTHSQSAALPTLTLGEASPESFQPETSSCSNTLSPKLIATLADGEVSGTKAKKKGRRSTEAVPDQAPMMQHVCPISSCGRQYKSLNGLTYHLEHGHGISKGAKLDSLRSSSNFENESEAPPQPVLTPTIPWFKQKRFQSRTPKPAVSKTSFEESVDTVEHSPVVSSLSKGLGSLDASDVIDQGDGIGRPPSMVETELSDAAGFPTHNSGAVMQSETFSPDLAAVESKFVVAQSSGASQKGVHSHSKFSSINAKKREDLMLMILEGM